MTNDNGRANEFESFYDLVMDEIVKALPGDANRDQRVAAGNGEFLSLFTEDRAAAEAWLAEEIRLDPLRFAVFVRDWTGAYRR